MMWASTTRIACVAVVFASCLAATANSEIKLNDADRLTMQATMKTHCFTCHGSRRQKGDVNLEAALADLSNTDNARLLGDVIKMVKVGEMPPADRDPLSETEKETFLKRVDAAIVALGSDSVLHDLNTDPHFANYTDHEELFSGKHKGPAFTPSRVWYKKSDYANTGTVNGPTLDNLLTFFTVRITKQVDGELKQGKLNKHDAEKMKARSEQLKQIKKIENEEERLAALKTVPPKIDPPMVPMDYNKDYHAFANAEGDATEAECEAVIRTAFVEILRRPPLDHDELTKYASLLKEKVDALGRNRGLKVALLSIHLKPEVFYRLEFGLGRKLPDGRRQLTSMETYYALCHALGVVPTIDVGVPPRVRGGREGAALPPLSSALLAAAYEDKLTDPQAIRDLLRPYLQIRRKEQASRTGYYYDDARDLIGPRQKMVDFIRTYFGYAEAEDNFKDRTPNRPKELIQDADRFVNLVLDDDRDVLKQLLTADTFAFPSHKHIGFESTSRGRFGEHRRHWGVDVKDLKNGADRIELRQVDLGGKHKANLWFITFENRAGLLTHPVWNFAHSKNDETDPVVRGKWIREKLLAGTIREVPVQVDAKVSNDHSKTLRERFEEKVDSDAYCWSCHKKMNPLGMPFESYDELGQYRTMDNIAEKPIDSTGHIDGTGEPDVDGEVKNAVELAERLAHSTRVRQSFVRHAFRFWMGRNEMLSDSPTLIAADKAYLESDGSMQALVLSLLTSDSFLYRK